MALMKHNYLKSDIFFNPTFIPCFLGPGFYSPGTESGSRFRVQVIEVAQKARVRVQGPGPGYRSSPKFLTFKS